MGSTAPRALKLELVVLVVFAVVGSLWLGTEIAHGQTMSSLLIILALFVVLFATRDPFDNLLLWLLLAPAFDWWGGIELGYRIPNLTPHRALLGLAFIQSLLQYKALRSQALARHTPEIVPSLLYLVYSAATIFLRATSFGETFGWFQITLLPALAFYLPLMLVSDEERVQRILRIMPVVVLYLFLPALYEQFTQTPIIPDTGLWEQGSGVSGVRSSSLAGAASTLSNMGLLLIPFMVYRLGQHRQNRWRRVWDLTLLVCALGIVLLSSFRSAWIVLVAILGLATLGLRRARKTLGAFLLATGGLLGWFWDDLASTELFQRRILDPTNVAARAIVLQEQIARLWENPLFGSGGDEALQVYSLQAVVSSHNTFLSIALHIGLFGLLLYLAPLVIIAFRTVRESRVYVPDEHPYLSNALMISLWLSILGMMINGMSMDIRYFALPNALLWFILGLIARIAVLRRNALA